MAYSEERFYEKNIECYIFSLLDSLEIATLALLDGSIETYLGDAISVLEDETGIKACLLEFKANKSLKSIYKEEKKKFKNFDQIYLENLKGSFKENKFPHILVFGKLEKKRTNLNNKTIVLAGCNYIDFLANQEEKINNLELEKYKLLEFSINDFPIFNRKEIKQRFLEFIEKNSTNNFEFLREYISALIDLHSEEENSGSDGLKQKIMDLKIVFVNNGNLFIDSLNNFIHILNIKNNPKPKRTKKLKR